MLDFHASTGSMPLDQAQGLRRLFTGAQRRSIALVANPHVPFAGSAIEQLCHAIGRAGHRTLVLDAADTSPPPPEAAALDLGAALQWLTPKLAWLPARGLPQRYVNTRGSSARLLDALAEIAPEIDVTLAHASAPDLARLFAPRALRPVLLAADHPESVKHAYASMKLLAQRCGWRACDLLIVAPSSSPRLPHIATSVARCADTFVGATLAAWAVADPAAADDEPKPAFDALAALIAGQLQADPDEPRLGVAGAAGADAAVGALDH
jgi:flagellar biosynthesis protein FlhG